MIHVVRLCFQLCKKCVFSVSLYQYLHLSICTLMHVSVYGLEMRRRVCVCVELLLRHGRCFWFSGHSGGDHCKARVLERGVASVHGLGTVWRQDAAILPHTSCDGQTGLVPHGFRKRQLIGRRWQNRDFFF